MAWPCLPRHGCAPPACVPPPSPTAGLLCCGVLRSAAARVSTAGRVCRGHACRRGKGGGSGGQGRQRGRSGVTAHEVRCGAEWLMSCACLVSAHHDAQVGCVWHPSPPAHVHGGALRVGRQYLACCRPGSGPGVAVAASSQRCLQASPNQRQLGQKSHRVAVACWPTPHALVNGSAVKETVVRRCVANATIEATLRSRCHSPRPVPHLPLLVHGNEEGCESSRGTLFQIQLPLSQTLWRTCTQRVWHVPATHTVWSCRPAVSPPETAGCSAPASGRVLALPPHACRRVACVSGQRSTPTCAEPRPAALRCAGCTG